MLETTLVDFVSLTLAKLENERIVKRFPSYAFDRYFQGSGLCAQCGTAPHGVSSAFCSDECYELAWPNKR